VNKKINVRSLIQIDKALLEDISDLISSKSSQSLLNILYDLHPADIAELMNHLTTDDATYIFHLLDTETASEVIVEVDENIREAVLEETETSKITDIVDELELDDATDIVAELPDEIAEEVLENLEREDSEDVKELLKYPVDSAGGIMSSDFISINEHATVKDAIEEIRNYSEDIDHIYQLYILTDSGKLLGTVLLKSLLINPLEKSISSIVEEDLIFVTPDTDQEEVAQMMEKYDLISIPVVDENRIMLGRITIDDVVDVIHEEAAEDIQKLAGLTEEEEVSDSALAISRNRLPWLFVSLIGELVSASVLSSFQATLEQIYIAGIFIPIVMAMGGSSGTQSAIVVVRGLATGDIWLGQNFKRLFKEFKVALFNGLACGAILLVATLFFWQSGIRFSLILSVSLIIIMINATMIGAVVPLMLKKVGIDPAIAAGPFVATTNDIIGLIIYFSLITIFYFK